MIDPDARFDELVAFMLGPKPEAPARPSHSEAKAAAVMALLARGGATMAAVAMLLDDIDDTEPASAEVQLLARYGEQSLPELLNVIALACVEIGK